MYLNLISIFLLVLSSTGSISQNLPTEYYNAIDRAYAFYEQEEYDLGINELEIISVAHQLLPNDKKGLIYGYSKLYEYHQAFELIKELCDDSINFNKENYQKQFYEIKEVEGWDEFSSCLFKEEIKLDTSYYSTIDKKIHLLKIESLDSLFHYYLEIEKHTKLKTYYDSLNLVYNHEISEWLDRTSYEEIKASSFFNKIHKQSGRLPEWFIKKHAPLFELAFENQDISPFEFLIIHRSKHIYDFGYFNIGYTDNPTEEQKSLRKKYNIGSYPMNFYGESYWRIKF